MAELTKITDTVTPYIQLTTPLDINLPSADGEQRIDTVDKVFIRTVTYPDNIVYVDVRIKEHYVYTLGWFCKDRQGRPDFTAKRKESKRTFNKLTTKDKLNIYTKARELLGE